ncbi:shikimate kinase [Portibacter marinus]|uniref:shikimate kinase n=1 Tax=Portibacter marinus TaxID=2898660 RepID=UPI001F260AD6|nr:shikimate kinase [Portibacter marinus]
MYTVQKRIYLLGFMGSGKSTIARELSVRLDIDFVDLDDYIINKENLSVKRIFEEKGEVYFRQLEAESLHELLYKSPLIVALGGGTPCHNDNMTLINHTGTSFYLKLSPQALTDRLLEQKEHRPLISSAQTKSDLKQLIDSKLQSRLSYYEKAHHIIDGAQSPEKITEMIVRQLDS